MKKHLENFIAKTRKKMINLWQKFEIIFKTFIKISANFIIKFIKIPLKFQVPINLNYNPRKDFETLHMYTYLFL